MLCLAEKKNGRCLLKAIYGDLPCRACSGSEWALVSVTPCEMTPAPFKVFVISKGQGFGSFQLEGKEDECVVAGQRAHGFGRVRGHLNGAHAMHEERGRAGHDDEPGDEIGEDAADDHIETRGCVVLDANSLLYDRRLQVELHPRGDGGAHDTDSHVDVGLVAMTQQQPKANLP